MRRPATEEELNLLQKFLTDNKLKLSPEILTKYPDGVANTQVIIHVAVEEETKEEK